MFDARANTFSADGNLWFGVASVIVVAGCFFGVLLMPAPGGKDESSISVAAASVEPPALQDLSDPKALNTRLSSEDEQQFLKALLAVAPDKYIELQRKFSENDLTRQGEMQAIQTASTAAISEYAQILPYASTMSVNRVLNGLTTELRRAQQSGTKFCLGATYEGLQNKPQAALARWASDQNLSNEDFYPTAIRINGDLLEMIRQAKTNPARHGPFTRADQAAVQQALIGIMADPSVVRVMANSGDDQRKALQALNICSVGIAALTKLKALPEETKGRAWAAMLRHPEVEKSVKNARS